ncbi:hypothetical protein D3C76_729430 [compost metagenome]
MGGPFLLCVCDKGRVRVPLEFVKVRSTQVYKWINEGSRDWRVFETYVRTQEPLFTHITADFSLFLLYKVFSVRKMMFIVDFQ